MGILEATLPAGECVAYYWKLNQRLILTVSGATLPLAEYDTRKQASLRYAMFFTFGLLGPCFSGLLAYGIREIDGVQGKEGWRWIFILSKGSLLWSYRSWCSDLYRISLRRRSF